MNTCIKSDVQVEMRREIERELAVARLQLTATDCDRLQQTAIERELAVARLQLTATDCDRLQQTAIERELAVARQTSFVGRIDDLLLTLVAGVVHVCLHVCIYEYVSTSIYLCDIFMCDKYRSWVDLVTCCSRLLQVIHTCICPKHLGCIYIHTSIRRHVCMCDRRRSWVELLTCCLRLLQVSARVCLYIYLYTIDLCVSNIVRELSWWCVAPGCCK